MAPTDNWRRPESNGPTGTANGWRGGRGGGGWGAAAANGGGGGSSYGGGGGGRRHVSIPGNMAGRVIGSGGSKIRELKEESGAEIQVPRGDRNTPNIQIELSGTEAQMEMAQDLIEKLTLTGKHEVQMDIRFRSPPTAAPTT